MKNLIFLYLIISMLCFVACINDNKKSQEPKHKVEKSTVVDKKSESKKIEKIKKDSLLLLSKVVKETQQIIPEKKWDNILQTIAHKLWTAYDGEKVSPGLPFSIESRVLSRFGGSKAKKVAYYRPSDHKIVFNKEVLNWLKEKFPKDWETRLVAILGHEIWHFVQGDEIPFSMAFTSSSQNGGGTILSHIEPAADLNGNFLAFLAGYDTRGIYSETIKNIYEFCEIDTVATQRYPSLANRTKAADKAMEKLDGLVHLFNSANYLSLLGEYEWADVCYRSIQKTGYNGTEIYYNQGINSLLQATYSDERKDKYVWPIGLENVSCLTKYWRGGALASRQESLAAAQKRFEKVLKIAPSYDKAALQILIVLALKEGPKEQMLNYYKQFIITRKNTSLEFKEQAKLVTILYDLQYSKNGSVEEEAFQLLRQLASSESNQVKQLVERNIQVYKNEDRVLRISNDIDLDKISPFLTDDIIWGQPMVFSPVSLHSFMLNEHNIKLKLEINDEIFELSSEEVNYKKAIKNLKGQFLPFMIMRNNWVYLFEGKQFLLVIQKRKKRAYVVKIKK